MVFVAATVMVIVIIVHKHDHIHGRRAHHSHSRRPGDGCFGGGAVALVLVQDITGWSGNVAGAIWTLESHLDPR